MREQLDYLDIVVVVTAMCTVLVLIVKAGFWIIVKLTKHDENND